MKRSSLHRVITPAATVAALALTLAACGGNNEDGGDTASGLSGSVNIDGSSTVGPMAKVAAELFGESNPDVKVTVGESGSGGGFEKFCAGETDISNASRPIEDDEVAACEKDGINFQEMVIANDALTVVLNANNDWATCLTVEQLNTIWDPKSEGKVTNWNQVDPSFPDVPLELFGPGTDSGTFDYFTDVVNGEEGASRADYQPSEDDNVIIEGVAGSKGGLGYLGYTYYEQNADKVNAVQIDGGGGCVSPSAEAVQDGTYTPLARPLFIYPSVGSMSDNEAFASFVQYYVDNDAAIAEAALYIPLSTDQKSTLDSEFADLQSAAGL